MKENEIAACRDVDCPFYSPIRPATDSCPGYTVNEKKRPVRDNPKYPPYHCFTAMKCHKCGEMFEPSLEHICRKKNSYPVKETQAEANEDDE